MSKVNSAGFTLMELMLVLALIVAISALAVPALIGPLRSENLKHAGDELRTAMAKARVRAMRTGSVHLVQLVPGGRQYEIRRWVGAMDMLESGLDDPLLAGGLNQPRATGPALPGQGPGAVGAAGVPGAGGVPSVVSGEGASVEVKLLPEGVVCGGVMSTNDSRDLMMVQEIMATGAAGSVTTPILFYPDGTSSTVQVVLQGPDQLRVEVRLRGLTGSTTISDVLAPGEVAL